MTDPRPAPQFYLGPLAAARAERLRQLLLGHGLQQASEPGQAGLYICETMPSEAASAHQFWIVLAELPQAKLPDNCLWWPAQAFDNQPEAFLGQLMRSLRLWQRTQNLGAEAEPIDWGFFRELSGHVQTHLKGVSGLANLLREEYLSHVQRQKYADYIAGNANRLQTYFVNLSEYCDYRVQQASLAQETFSLLALMSELRERYLRILASADNDQVGIRLQFSRRLGPEQRFRADKRRLLIVLSNLLEQATQQAQSGNIVWRVAYENGWCRTQLWYPRHGSAPPYDRPPAGFAPDSLVWWAAQLNAEMLHGELRIDHHERYASAWFSWPMLPE